VEEDEVDGALSENGERRNMYRLLVGESERKDPPGRPGRRWISKIKMELLEIVWSGVDSIGLT
jgi:hypothetical protein